MQGIHGTQRRVEARQPDAGDVIFIKGSQGMRMERAVKILMADPDEAKDFLVRQDEEWEKK